MSVSNDIIPTSVCDIFNDGYPCSPRCEWYEYCDKPEKWTENSEVEE